MTDRELKALFKDSAELAPPPEAKEKILLRATAEMENKKAKNKNSFFSNFTKKLMPIAACFVFVVLIAGVVLGVGSGNYHTVYVDVNPSAALHVNRFGKVKDVEYLNTDAKKALKGVKLKGLTAEDALEEMIKAYDEAGYFEADAEIYISAISNKNKNSDKLLRKLAERAEKVKGEKNYSVNVNEHNAHDKSEAEKYGISPGKYRVISEIIEEDSTYTVEDLKDKSMSELKDMLSGGKDKNNGKK